MALDSKPARSNMRPAINVLVLAIAINTTGCATYTSKAVPFRPPAEYGNSVNITGVRVGAESFADQKSAEDTFGFDIRSAGLLPVQVALDNQSGQRVQIIASQSFLIDEKGRYWNVIPTYKAAQRVSAATSDGFIGLGAGKSSMYGAAAGSILGLALGVVSGGKVGNAALTGGVLGAAGGALIGGTSAAESHENSAKVMNDVSEKDIDGKVVPAGALASGFIFFPGEAPGAKAIRLQIRFKASGETHTMVLPFTPGEQPQVVPPSTQKKADG